MMPCVHWTVRVASPSDHERVGEIFRDASLSNDGDRTMLLEHPEFLVFDAAALQEGRTHVALADDQVVGFVTTRFDAGVCELEDIFVDPAWMRHGVGTRLMSAAVDVTRAADIGRIEVTANGHAMDFYRRVGFVLDGDIELEYGHGYRMHLTVES